MENNKEYTTWIMMNKQSIMEALTAYSKSKEILIKAKDWDGVYLLTQLMRDKIKTAHIHCQLNAEEVEELDKRFRLFVWE